MAFHHDALGLPDQGGSDLRPVQVVLVFGADQGGRRVGGEQQTGVLVGVGEHVNGSGVRFNDARSRSRTYSWIANIECTPNSPARPANFGHR